MLTNKKHCVPNNAMVEVKNTMQNEAYMTPIQWKSEKSSNSHGKKGRRFLP
jgi:hypothetical protein